MTRDLNLAFAGPTAGVTLLALVGLMGCTSASGAQGTTGEMPRNTPAPATAALTDVPSKPVLRPLAEIVTAQGAVLGELGSYAMDGAGGDAPWLPFSTIPSVEIGSTDTLQVRFADSAAIGDVSTLFAAAADTNGTHLHAVPVADRSADGSSVNVGPLPPGQWVLAARIFRADGRGDGMTYWAVTVR
ncbi:MAG: hypothetical protein ABI573_00020 [Chloroflexota bacterium]